MSDPLDGLLATLERCELSPTEARVLLWLEDREGTPADLTVALEERPGRIARVGNRLARRGLIRRRFHRGQRSYFVFAIAPCGLDALRPLKNAVRETDPGETDASTSRRGPQRAQL